MNEADTAALRQFGSNVRTVRVARGLTHETLAERSGLSLDTISKVERAKMSASLLTIARLARGLGCTTSEILTHL